MPELDGHTEEEVSTFHSIQEEADRLAEQILETLAKRSFCWPGCRIAAAPARRKDITIEYLVLDGAPLLKLPVLAAVVMEKNYSSIIRGAKRRDPKTLAQCTKVFLPEAHLDEFPAIADRIKAESIHNILSSVFSDFEMIAYPQSMKLFFLHGTKEGSGEDAEEKPFDEDSLLSWVCPCAAALF